MDSCVPPETSSDEVGPSLVPEIVPELFCDPCLENGIDILVEGYCVDCAHHLCEKCFLNHCRPKLSRHHQLLDRQLMPKSKSDKVYRHECADKCETYGDKTLQYFCEDHKLFACSICVTLGHKKCNVGYVPTLSADLFDSQEYKAFKRDIELLTRTTRSLQEAATRNLESVGQHAKRAIDKIRKLRIEIDTFFDGLEQGILDQVTQIKNEDQNKIEALSKQCEVLAGKIKDLEADIEDKASKKQKRRLFVDMKELQDTVDKYKKDIHKMKKTNTIRDLTFRPSEKISRLIRNQSAKFGSLVDFCQTIRVHDTYYITDIVESSEGNIAVIDGEKGCIAVIFAGHVITSKCLSKDYGYSTQITALPNSEIAAVFCGDIQLYESSEDILLKKKTISTSLRGRGLVYCNNMFIGVTLSSPPTLCMVNMNGDVVKTFSTQIDGENMFESPQHIAVNPDETAIYVTDWGNETVTCLTFDGDVKSRYKYSNGWSPQGVAVSRDGLVYVGDYENNNIHILTSDLEEMGLIDGKKYGVHSPHGLCYCAREHKLYVGGEKRFPILVFHI